MHEWLLGFLAKWLSELLSWPLVVNTVLVTAAIFLFQLWTAKRKTIRDDRKGIFMTLVATRQLA